VQDEYFNAKQRSADEHYTIDSDLANAGVAFNHMMFASLHMLHELIPFQASRGYLDFFLTWMPRGAKY
jgi:hypothetical protein